MGKRVSRYSKFSSDENHITNHCLFLIQQIYEDTPRNFKILLSSLFGENISAEFGIIFEQQVKRDETIPDGVIRQTGADIAIETKLLGAAIDRGQLEGHLRALDADASSEMKCLLVLTPFETSTAVAYSAMRDELRNQFPDIQILFRSFEEFLEAIRELALPGHLVDALDDMATLFDEFGLLPNWKGWLDVVNCAQLEADIIEHGAYVCPAAGGAYNHQRCEYFGLYKEKCVSLIARISAVVDIQGPSDDMYDIKWHSFVSDDDAVNEARKRLACVQRDGFPWRVFVLDEPNETEFKKDTRGGMMGSKLYFDLRGLDTDSTKGLAERLRGKVWSDFR